MRTHLLVLLATGCSAAATSFDAAVDTDAGAVHDLAAATSGDQGGSNLVFSDEFNGAAVDTTKWWVANLPGDQSNSEKQCYQPANTVESGGNLSETVKVQSACNGFAYTSGAVQMSPFNFTYGTVEVRAKFTGGTGPWPAIWLLGKDCQSPNWLASTCPWPNPGSDEIDIAEILGSNLGLVNQAIHSSGGNPGCQANTSDVSQNWHIYTLVWAPGQLTFKIDGATTCTLTQAVPATPMFLILNTSLGGAGGGTIDNATLPQTTQFDYVRITQP